MFENWGLKGTDKEWIERHKLAVHSCHKTKEKAEKTKSQLWHESYTEIDEFMVYCSDRGKFWEEQRYCVLISNPDIIM